MSKVILVPWDPQNEEHFQRMYDQRVSWGWFPPDPTKDKQWHLEGRKAVFWVALSDAFEDKEDALRRHAQRYPKERSCIKDTAVSSIGVARQTFGDAFTPIGHVLLDRVAPPDCEGVDFPVSTIWVKSLYVSWVLQGSGVGRQAVHAIERVAAESPLKATTTALDTITKEFQSEEWYLKEYYDDLGNERPRIVNEDWYQRLGYKIVGRRADEIPDEKKGGIKVIPLLIMRKDLARS
ncbi:Hypothetical protein D9617_19g101550 [Elsinoe fawcettii]|nr:Hypothetical protein D9617_19g101550 [Elsinoe fawcettii]